MIINKRNVLLNNNSKFRLIGKINGLSNEVKRARNAILNSKKDSKKWHAAYRKMIVGVDVRHHLLAYAFLRGKPYLKMESHCRKDHKPSVELILRVAVAHDSSWNPIAKEENIVAWLKGAF